MYSPLLVILGSSLLKEGIVLCREYSLFWLSLQDAGGQAYLPCLHPTPRRDYVAIAWFGAPSYWSEIAWLALKLWDFISQEECPV